MSDISELRAILSDPWLRLTSGAIYKIKIKATSIYSAEGVGGGGGSDGGETDDKIIFEPPTPEIFKNSGNYGEFPQDVKNSGEILTLQKNPDNFSENQVVPFIPNEAQLKFLKRLWNRNCILKCRQRGFTTLVAIMWLDHALFNANQKCGMIAQTRDAAEEIFRDKVLLAYNELPPTLRERMPLSQQNSSQIEFAHNRSRIIVTNSARSGTFDRLHISEFGKIGARDPAKAREIITGSLPAVPTDGIVVVESTAEGTDGEFYRMVQQSMAHVHSGKKLNKKEFRMQFFPWWEATEYAIDDASARISPEDEQYFSEVEALIQATGYMLQLTHAQKVWWVTTRDAEFGGQDEMMWQEYPAYPAEAFKVSTDGVYFAKQLSAARKAKRIGVFPHVPGLPVNTFWDIGNSDGTGIWLHQRVGGENRFIRYLEGWEEHYEHFTKALQETGYIWGTHYLPHDAEHKRQLRDRITCPLDELKATKLGGKWVTVPRVDDLQHGIQMTRQAFASSTFDEAGCKKGLDHLWNYRKIWSRARSTWSDTPDKSGGHSEAADAFRQFAQAGIGAGAGSTLAASESWSKFKNRRRNR